MAQTGEGCAGLVTAQLTLATTAARPGDAVTALLQVSCAQPEVLELQEVEVEFSGVERVDTSWVMPGYRRGTPPINTDKRKVQRYVVQSRLQAATQGTFSDLTLRRFVVRFTLPAWLPPTFRGTAARYLYFLQATVKYRGAEAAGGAGGSAEGSVACRTPLHIWPTRQQQLEGATLERMPSLAGAGAAAAAPDGSLLAPPIQSEDMPIKCWEIGPGTAVQDAVAHIAKLASQPGQSPGRPQSPGRMVRGGAVGVSGDIDAHSEISHEPEGEEAEGAPARSGSGTAGIGGAAAAGAAVPPPAEAAQGGGGGGSELGSGASTPRSSRLIARRNSLAQRPSLEAAAALMAPRSPSQLLHDGGATLRSYGLRIGDHPLVRVSLHPPLEGSLHPGSTLAGTLEFSHPALAASAAQAAAEGGDRRAAAPGPRCMQVLILLETEEVVEAPWRRPVAGGGAGGIRRVHDEQLEVTADTACTHFIFTLPPDAAASFQTPLLQLRWLLRFQFTASLPPAGAAPGAEWNPLAGRLEQLSWTLPLAVLPPAA